MCLSILRCLVAIKMMHNIPINSFVSFIMLLKLTKMQFKVRVSIRRLSSSIAHLRMWSSFSLSMRAYAEDSIPQMLKFIKWIFCIHKINPFLIFLRIEIVWTIQPVSSKLGRVVTYTWLLLHKTACSVHVGSRGDEVTTSFFSNSIANFISSLKTHRKPNLLSGENSIISHNIFNIFVPIAS